jgi:hypothetical protein
MRNTACLRGCVPLCRPRDVGGIISWSKLDWKKKFKHLTRGGLVGALDWSTPAERGCESYSLARFSCMPLLSSLGFFGGDTTDTHGPPRSVEARPKARSPCPKHPHPRNTDSRAGLSSPFGTHRRQRACSARRSAIGTPRAACLRSSLTRTEVLSETSRASRRAEPP